MNDLRFALRQLLKTPGFTLVAVLSLALGIGTNATVLTWIENLVARPLPGVADQDRLVVITTSQGDRMWDTNSLADLRDMAALPGIFSGVTGSQTTPAFYTDGEQDGWLYGQIVTANFFDVMGVRPVLGRTFRPDEETKPGGHPVLVLSETVWRQRFGADPRILGRTIRLNRHAFTIVGVVPAGFQGDTGALACAFWAPAMMFREVAYTGSSHEAIFRRTARWHHSYGRLQPGVSVAQARAALDALGPRLEQAHPDTNRNIRFHAWPQWESTYGSQKIFRPVLGLLWAATFGVLLIVTANVASLLLARAAGRQREVAIRLAIGASRYDLIRLLLVESLLVAVAGGLLGALVSRWLVPLVVAFLPATPHLPIHVVGDPTLRSIGLSALLTLGSGLVFGLAPALQAIRTDLNTALKDGGRSGQSTAHHRLRSGLVVTEVALAVALLIGATLCYKGLQSSRTVDAGLEARHVMLAGLRIGMNGYTRDTAPEFYRQLRARAAALPGVESAAFASWFPLGFEDTGSGNIEIPGQERPAGAMSFRFATVSPGYFATLGIPLTAGRDFHDLDTSEATRVLIVNEHFARRFWPGQDAVGRTVKVNGRDLTVVGVAKAGKYRALNEPPEPFYYIPADQNRSALDLTLCVRLAPTESDGLSLLDRPGGSEAITRRLQETIHALDPNVSIWVTLPLSSYIQAAVMPARLASGLLASLSVIALLLAAMGVYAVMAYAVSQRTQEFGVRLALGATGARLLWQVVRQGLLLAAIGAGLGLMLAFVITRLLTGFLYGVSPFDPLTFIGVPLLLGLVALLACWLPARRATKVDPMTALRAE